MRADPERVGQVREMLARSIQPQSPTDVEVTRPSDALAAQQAADQAFTGLLVGLGGVALLVGGIGVANTMVISVPERPPNNKFQGSPCALSAQAHRASAISNL